MTIDILIAIIIVLATEFGIVFTHVFPAAHNHAHWAHKPWIEGLGIANWYHVASFLSHWPAVFFIHLNFIPLFLWPVTLILCDVIWSFVKSKGEKSWDRWYIQLIKRILN